MQESRRQRCIDVREEMKTHSSILGLGRLLCLLCLQQPLLTSADMNYELVRHITCKLLKWRTDQLALRNARLRTKAHSQVGIMRGMVLEFAFAGTFGLAITLTFAKALVFAFALWLRAWYRMRQGIKRKENGSETNVILRCIAS